MKVAWFNAGLAFAALLVSLSAKAQEAPPVADLFANYCYDCHDAATAKGEINLERLVGADWKNEDTAADWELVLNALKAGEMPPKKKAQPTPAEREFLVKAVHRDLLAHSKTGGTVLRRLNRAEYEQSIRSIFGLDYQVPASFPPDTIKHGFDNAGDGLVVSPPLMESYFHAAIEIADRLFPPPAKPVEAKTTTLVAKDLVISYSSGAIIDGAMRLAAQTDQMWRSSTWPERFEVRTPGKYRLRVSSSAFAPGTKANPKFEGPMRLRVLARSLNGKDGEAVSKQRKLAEFEVSKEAPEWFECTVELKTNETPVFYFANAPLDGDGDKASKASFTRLLREMFERDQRLLAGWLKVKHASGLRGGLGWDRVKAIRDDAELDLSTVDLSKKKVDELVAKMVKNPGLYVETVIFQFFEEGPALEIHEVEIEGPLDSGEVKPDLKREKLVERFMESGAEKDEVSEQVKGIMTQFLTRAFRRPAEVGEVEAYTRLVLEHRERVPIDDSTKKLEAGLHLAIRTALLSPKFLYRGNRPGTLDNFDLANRLAYFLTGAPPDQELFEVALAGELTEPERLATETKRLLNSRDAARFVRNFTGQWLGTRHLAEIMPDARLINFKPAHRDGMIGESERFFQEILKRNLPMKTFLDPGFTFVNAALAKDIYKLKGVKGRGLVRVDLPPDSPFGGILGQAGVMMATANGVDTQPVERGVWVLRNVLGDPPRDPPEDVPALTPDTRGTQTVREQLAAHRNESSCASCHRKIDPIGFALENFDPVGRWRTHYSVLATNAKGKTVFKKGAAIDARGEYSDGTPFQGSGDLRAYAVANIDQFSQCLSEKLLTYATGRLPNYSERQEVAEIVARVKQNGNGFRDLLVALVQSKAFGTK